MRHALDLGLRFARAGGVLRTVSIALATAFASFVIAGALSFPAALGGMPRSGIAAAIVMAIMVIFGFMPSLLLIVVASQISAATRDARLASLRLIGYSPTQVRGVAAAEVGVQAIGGAVGGLMLYAVVAPLTSGEFEVAHFYLFTGLDFSWFTAVIAFLLVLGATLFASQVRVGSLHARDSRQRRTGVRKKPSAWRVVPYSLGLAVGVTVLVLPRPAPEPESNLMFEYVQRSVTLLFVAIALGVIGAVIAVPWLVDRWARWRVGRGGRLPSLLAGRGILAEPAGAVRVIAGLTFASALVMGGAGYLGILTATKEYQQESAIYTSGPTEVRVGSGPTGTLTAADLTYISLQPDISIVTGVLDIGYIPTPAPGSIPIPGLVFAVPCSVITAQLQADCDTGRPFVLYSATAGIEESQPQAVRFTLADQWDQVDPHLPAIELGPAVLAPIDSRFFGTGLVVPAESLATIGDPRIRQAVVWIDAGHSDATSIVESLVAAGYNASVHELSTYSFAQIVRLALIATTIVLVSMGLMAVLLGALDRARERRRAVASLAVVGVPLRTIRAAQFGQVAIPALIGMVLALVSAVLFVFGGVRLAYDDAFSVDPVAVSSLVAITAIIVVLTLMVAGATTLGLGRRPTPETLRRE